MYTSSSTGLRLPNDGVSAELANNINISSNASMGSLYSESFQLVQLVGYFEYASLDLIAMNGLGTAGSTNTFNVTFRVREEIAIGDVVIITVPGVSFDSNGIVMTTYVPYADTPTTATDSFTIAFTSSTYEISLTASSIINGETTVVLSVANAFLPSEGFPMKRDVLQDSTHSASDVTIALSSVNGDIEPQPFSECVTAGVESATIHYIVRDIAQPIGLRVQFQLTESIVANDVLSFHLPFIEGPSSWGSTIQTLNYIYGDQSDADFEENFIVTYNPATSDLILTASGTEPAREINVHVDSANLLSVVNYHYLKEGGTVNGTHHMEAALTNIPGLARRLVDYTPEDIVGLVVPYPGVQFDGVNMSSCSYGEVSAPFAFFLIAITLLS